MKEKGTNFFPFFFARQGVFFRERASNPLFGRLKASALPVPILVPVADVLEGLLHGVPVTAVVPLAGEGEVVSLPHGLHVHLVHADAVLHAGHGGYQPGGLVQVVCGERTRDALVPSQCREAHHGADVALRVVLGGRGPSGDDVAQCVGHPSPGEVQPVVVQNLPGGAVSVGHRTELHEALVGLCYGCSLPSVGRAADVQRVVVS